MGQEAGVKIFIIVSVSLLEYFQQYCLTVAFLHCFFLMLVGFNLNVTYGLKPQVSIIKIVTVYKRFSFESLYHKDSITSRPLNKVKPCSSTFAPGGVTNYENHVL